MDDPVLRSVVSDLMNDVLIATQTMRHLDRVKVISQLISELSGEVVASAQGYEAGLDEEEEEDPPPLDEFRGTGDYAE